ncbi:MAG: NAD(P)/FAD-dependent oxidoreductase [Blautia sp.]|jgi:thioredoxin reductase (NADPH)
MEDMIIIGAGPAGISASLYAIRAGVKPLVLYHGTGALEKAEKIENFYGNSEFLTGSQLQERGILQARQMGVQFQETQVLGIGGFDTFVVKTTEGDLEARCVVLATGAKRSSPKVPGLKEFEGKGVSYCAICDAFFYRGKQVAVFGNSDFALHEARELAPMAGKVTILTNGLVPDFGEEVEFPVDTRIIEKLEGEDRITQVDFQDGSSLPVDGFFVAFGTAGTSQMAKQMGAELTEKGHIVVDSSMQTTIPGLYAAGDCTGGLLQISKAVYEGTLAGIEGAKYVKRQKKHSES